jgi:hypothetical protein
MAYTIVYVNFFLYLCTRFMRAREQRARTNTRIKLNK